MATQYTVSRQKETLLPLGISLAVAHFLHQAAALLFAEAPQFGLRGAFVRIVVRFSFPDLAIWRVCAGFACNRCRPCRASYIPRANGLWLAFVRLATVVHGVRRSDPAVKPLRRQPAVNRTSTCPAVEPDSRLGGSLSLRSRGAARDRLGLRLVRCFGNVFPDWPFAARLRYFRGRCGSRTFSAFPGSGLRTDMGQRTAKWESGAWECARCVSNEAPDRH